MTVYLKTPAGAAEVARRSDRISLLQRRLLILVDGQRSAGELAAILPPGAFDEALAPLLSLGLVAPLGGELPEPLEADPLDVPTVTPSAAAAGAIDLAEARRRAVRELVDRLGPDADALAMRIEACRESASLRDCVSEAARLVDAVLGASASQDYLAALRRG